MPTITPYEALEALLALASALWALGTFLALHEADKVREARNARPPMAVWRPQVKDLGCPHREDGYCTPCHNVEKARERALQRALMSEGAFTVGNLLEALPAPLVRFVPPGLLRFGFVRVRAALWADLPEDRG